MKVKMNNMIDTVMARKLMELINNHWNMLNESDAVRIAAIFYEAIKRELKNLENEIENKHI